MHSSSMWQKVGEQKVYLFIDNNCECPKTLFSPTLNWFEDDALLEQTASWWTVQSQRVRQCISTGWQTRSDGIAALLKRAAGRGPSCRRLLRSLPQQVDAVSTGA